MGEALAAATQFRQMHQQVPMLNAIGVPHRRNDAGPRHLQKGSIFRIKLDSRRFGGRADRIRYALEVHPVAVRGITIGRHHPNCIGFGDQPSREVIRRLMEHNRRSVGPRPRRFDDLPGGVIDRTEADPQPGSVVARAMVDSIGVLKAVL